MFYAGISEMRLQMRRALPRSNASVRNTRPRMVDNCVTRLNCLPLGSVRRPKRHANMNRGSTHRLRFNGNHSIHEPSALAHAGETQTIALQCRFEVEPFACIANEEMNRTRVFPK